METLSRQEVLNKLNKLRAFIERDCGNESINAQAIADRLIQKYNISPAEFSYVHFSVKQKMDAENAEIEKRWREQRAQQAQRDRAIKRDYDITVSHVDSKKITIALLEKMALRYTIKGWKIKVYCTIEQYSELSRRLEVLKSYWKQAIQKINEEMINRISEI